MRASDNIRYPPPCDLYVAGGGCFEIFRAQDKSSTLNQQNPQVFSCLGAVATLVQPLVNVGLAAFSLTRVGPR